MANFKTAYSKRVPSKTNITEFGDSLTVQEQKEATDINNIVARFAKTGLIEHVNENEPQYGEFANYDYAEAMRTTARIQSSFNELPAEVRKQFDNNPSEWIEHLANPANIDDMRDGVIDNPVELNTDTGESAAVSENTASDKPVE